MNGAIDLAAADFTPWLSAENQPVILTYSLAIVCNHLKRYMPVCHGPRLRRAHNSTEKIPMTNGKTLIALSTAIALGLLGDASVAQASNENDGGNETGGFVVPGSTVGVN